MAQVGAVRPGFGHPLTPVAYVAAALLVGVGFLTVRAAAYLRTEEAGQRLRLGGYLAGALLVACQFSLTADATEPGRVGSLLLYAAAAVMVIWNHRVHPPRPRLLIATGLDPSALRERLAGETDTVAVYRADRVTDELRELEARYRLILVVGAEHDPRAKERVSASGLGREIPDIAEREVEVAGPVRFQRYVGGALARLSVPRSQVSFTSRQKV
ncbi:hypothetical protein C1J01_39545 [Nonomuraea aridisoli]|uniref:Uncharacterized protein n=1 Tax=Nonomuraea aridisoli TaxID=2070368 RepID=A0A2W2EUV7_9ACTN|nr:hypothetical protein C1J01_39545 [Nonomuraea aridisoli]